MALFVKLVCSSWRITHFVLLKFLAVGISGKSFLNEGLEFNRLSCAVIAEFSESSLWLALVCD